MKYAYENLSDDQFEKLVVLICKYLLGISVQGFTKGPDGGKDAKFVGTAELHPSKSSPWKGTTIIQAKHTNGYNRSFSESDFFSLTSNNTILGEELKKIKALKDNKQLDNYMLFANRRLTGNAEATIRKYISENCGIPEENLYLCDVEQIELFLKKFSDIADMADLDPLDSPLVVSPDDLSEVVQAFALHKNHIQDIFDDPPTTRILYEDKNKINNMSEKYAKAQRRKYLKETSTIRKFLAAPENTRLLRMYESTVDEFDLKIIAKRKDYQFFDNVMEYLTDLLFNRDPILRQHRRLTRAILFYMYWNCDIGDISDA